VIISSSIYKYQCVILGPLLKNDGDTEVDPNEEVLPLEQKDTSIADNIKHEVMIHIQETINSFMLKPPEYVHNTITSYNQM